MFSCNRVLTVFIIVTVLIAGMAFSANAGQRFIEGTLLPYESDVYGPYITDLMLIDLEWSPGNYDLLLTIWCLQTNWYRQRYLTGGIYRELLPLEFGYYDVEITNLGSGTVYYSGSIRH